MVPQAVVVACFVLHQVLVDGILGAGFSYLGANAGGALGPTIDKLYADIASPVLRQGLSNATASSVIGFGFAGTYGTTGDFSEATQAGLTSAGQGFGSGLVTGSVEGYKYARQLGVNPWTGQIPKLDIRPLGVIPDDSVFTVTKDGIVLPKECKLPDFLIENEDRIGDYGIMVNGRYKSQIRIDPGTTPGFKGPNESHFHIKGSGKHVYDLTNRPYR